MGALYRSTFHLGFFGENDCAFRSVGDLDTAVIPRSDETCMRCVLRCTKCSVARAGLVGVGLSLAAQCDRLSPKLLRRSLRLTLRVSSEKQVGGIG